MLQRLDLLPSSFGMDEEMNLLWWGIEKPGLSPYLKLWTVSRIAVI